MATERRYLKGDVVEVVESPNIDALGEHVHVGHQFVHNGVLSCMVGFHSVTQKFYAHQVELVKRPWWNWVRLPFVKKVRSYQRSQAR